MNQAKHSEAIVSASLDDLRLRHLRLLEEAQKLGRVRLLLWSDAAVERATGAATKFPQAERRYLAESIRFVDAVELIDDPASLADIDDGPSGDDGASTSLVVDPRDATPELAAQCQRRGWRLVVPATDELDECGPLPQEPLTPPAVGDPPRAIVTGCYDWLHSGHVRFFEEAAAYGELFVAVGHDRNIALLKGAGHPLFPEAQRRYCVGAVRFVAQAIVTSGDGWMDAAPEIDRLRPRYYVVNQDGDKPEKREFCAARGIEYVVLQRTPKAGLPKRESTALRGF